MNYLKKIFKKKKWERNGERKEWEDWWEKERKWEQSINNIYKAIKSINSNESFYILLIK